MQAFAKERSVDLMSDIMGRLGKILSRQTGRARGEAGRPDRTRLLK